MNVRESISELLDRHSKSLPPDYFGFYSSINALLARGVPPRAFCEVFAAELKVYDNEMRRYSERGDKGDNLSQHEMKAFKEAFSKFKLLNGCAEKLPVEMRRLISELAGCPVMGMPT